MLVGGDTQSRAIPRVTHGIVMFVDIARHQGRPQTDKGMPYGLTHTGISCDQGSSYFGRLPQVDFKNLNK